MNRLIWMGCLSYLLIGLAHVVIGSILVEMVGRYGVNYGVGGQLVFAQFSGFLVGVLAIPWLSSRWGKRSCLVVLSACLGVAELAYSFLPAWEWMYAIGFVAGFGFGGIEAVVGALIIDYIEEKKAVVMSRLEVLFGVGALVMPLIASWLILRSAWQYSFILIGVFSLIMALCWALLPLGKVDRDIAKSARVSAAKTGTAAYVRRELPLLVIFACFFLVYVGVEMSIVNFVPAVLIDHINITPAAASLSVTFFWITMAIGRLFAGFIAEKIQYANYLLWSTLGSLVIFIAFGFAPNGWSSFAAIMALGLTMSGIFAIALIYANALLPGRTERTTSILIACGGIGGALLPLATGWTIERLTMGAAIGLLAGGFAILLLLSIVAFRLKKRVVPQTITESA